MQTVEEKRKYQLAYKAANRERLAAQAKEYSLKNKERLQGTRKARYEKNRQARIEAQKKYYAANKEAVLGQRKSRYQTQKKAVAEKGRVWRLANPEKLRLRKKKYYDQNAERLKLKASLFRKANPGFDTARNRKHYALKMGNAHEPYKDIDIFDRDGWVCGICGQKINKRLKHPNPRSKSIDHIIPLKKGGADAPINLQAAHLRCNISKSAGGGGQLRLTS